MDSTNKVDTTNCKPGFFAILINYFGLAIITAIIVVIILLPPVDRFFRKQIPNTKVRLLVFFIITLAFVYTINRLVFKMEINSSLLF